MSLPNTTPSTTTTARSRVSGLIEAKRKAGNPDTPLTVPSQGAPRDPAGWTPGEPPLGKTGGCLLPHMHPGVWEGERAATGRGLNYYRAWLPARSSWGLPLARSWQFTGLSLPWGEGEKNRGSHVSAALPGRTLHSDVWLMSPL